MYYYILEMELKLFCPIVTCTVTRPFLTALFTNHQGYYYCYVSDIHVC